MTLANVEALLRDSIGLDPASIGSEAVARAVQERQAACALDDAGEYWRKAWTSEAERQELIEAVVVAETWFFRDRGAFDALAHLVGREWLPANPAGVLRVMSLPCSTGEEPYSIAMTLADAGVPAERFRVDAVDISVRALARAQNAVYGRNSFRGADLAFRGRHCEETPAGWRVKDRVRQRVGFERGNIFTADAVPGVVGSYHVVFCRNLLIYFDRDTQKRALNVVERLLTPNGLLFVAPSETALPLAHGFRPLNQPQSFGFRRANAAAPLAAIGAGAKRRGAVEPRTASQPVGAAARGPAVLLPTATSPSFDAPAAGRAALDAAARLADRGQFHEAIAACEGHLRQHGPSAAAFHLLGIVRDACGDAHEAMNCYRKALYLDPNEPEVMIHLALLMERFNRPADAQVLRDRARRAAVKGGAG